MRNLSLFGNRKNGVMVLRSCAKVKIFLIGILIIIVGYVGFQSDCVQKKFFYPYPYREFIMEYAAVRNLDSTLVAGVILSESKFEIDARSHKGAIGLMQLMPDTANWIAKQTEDHKFTLEDLNDPEINIRFGTWYLASLNKEFKGNEILMLAAYNAGRGNVKEWMNRNNWDMSFSDIDKIPYKETREYVTKVMKSKAYYKKLYDE
ncbi:lytic transglycosylase domain-containing protein [Anaerosinus massiliensis]|uniref:lytic transglycosylase domain-containing protein n=1 Tax=Massilibacillus massiliensis TaxID=1806837 RepID=UPI000A5951BC|nr:lytic transglycosylase domain-containing protein [Massilibacillus massiliensis]